MTFVSGKRARSVNYGSFVNLTDAPVVAIRADGVEFDGDLDAETVTDIWWWLTSKDDADEAARRGLAALREDPSTPACCRDVIAYLLGDS